MAKSSFGVPYEKRILPHLLMPQAPQDELWLIGISDWVLLLVETLNGDASFLTLGSPSPSSLSLESAFKHSPRSSVRLAPAPQVEGSSNPQADSHSQSEMTSSCLGTLGAMQGLNKSEAAKGFVISVESSRFLGSRVLWVPGFNFCHLSSVICYLLFFPYSVIVID